MATPTPPSARPYAPPPPPAAPDRRGATPPTVAGIVLLLLGALGLFGTFVGYGLADGRLSGWDRLSEGDSFGMPSSVVGIVSVIMLVVGLVLLGVGIGARRRSA